VKYVPYLEEVNSLYISFDKLQERATLLGLHTDRFEGNYELKLMAMDCMIE
jgi:hypothetical protein